jgi:hypothetical protein
MKNIILFFAVFMSSLLIISCSELKEGVPTSAPELALHKDGIINPSSPDFHGKIISSNNWDMKQCQQCHASNYTGGTAVASCYDCHTQPGGPEACNTCHGEFADPLRTAPPRSLDGSILTSSPGVGAHTAHLYENNIGKEILCVTCHKEPSNYSSEGHLGDDDKAEVIFGELAIHRGVNPNYSFTNNNCSDTYCHGNFVFYRDSSTYAFAYTAPTMVGSNVSVKWNQVDGSQTQCGSCHGLPPIGHVPATLNTCVNCHPGVVDNQGNIVDKTKHINGIKNVFGN